MAGNRSDYYKEKKVKECPPDHRINQYKRCSKSSVLFVQQLGSLASAYTLGTITQPRAFFPISRQVGFLLIKEQRFHRLAYIFCTAVQHARRYETKTLLTQGILGDQTSKPETAKSCFFLFLHKMQVTHSHQS